MLLRLGKRKKGLLWIFRSRRDDLRFFNGGIITWWSNPCKGMTKRCPWSFIQEKSCAVGIISPHVYRFARGEKCIRYPRDEARRLTLGKSRPKWVFL